MIAPLAKSVDWLAIQLIWAPAAIRLKFMRAPRANEPSAPPGEILRLEEALQFLQGPDFIPSESLPAKVEFVPEKSGLSFRFPTPRPGEVEANNIVYGRLYRAAGNWQTRPAIVLMPGAAGFEYRFPFPMVARRCNRAGFNAITLEPPYRFQRRPNRPGAQHSRGYLGSMETMAQTIAEVRALVGWLKGAGCPAVALWGASYGAWLASLAACRDNRLNAVVLSIPKVSPKLQSTGRIIWRSVREMLRGDGARFFDETSKTSLNLTLARPTIPKESILLIEAVHDLLVGAEPIEELWQAWGKPEIWRLPHGHVSFMTARGLTDRVLCWLSSRLDKPAALERPDDAAQQIAPGNAGWPVQFRFAVHVIWSRVPELWTFGMSYGSVLYRKTVRRASRREDPNGKDSGSVITNNRRR